jgi:hypothetical protein
VHRRVSRSKPGKNGEDENQAAARIVAQSTGQPIPSEKKLRSMAASILGKLGGSKGGHARAAKLTKDQASEIGRNAARARWEKAAAAKLGLTD